MKPPLIGAEPPDANELAYEQMRAGIGLMSASKLVQFDPANLQLLASQNNAFEAAAAELDPEYGRVARWILFSAGVEYLLKGVCLLNGWLKPQTKQKLRPPMEHEQIPEWVSLVVMQDPTVKVPVPHLGTFGDLPLTKLASATADKNAAMAAFKLFRESIRNRDAHYYAKDVRAAHFRVVPDLLVPAINAVLASVSNRDETRRAFIAPA